MKVVHVITKSGVERLTSLGSNQNLQSWWGNTRMCGAIIGNTWACPFDEISFAEIVDAHIESTEEREQDWEQKQAINRFAAGSIAAAIADGSFKPPKV